MNILALSRWFPYPPDNGSKLRIYQLLHALAQRHSVNLISFTNRSPLDGEMEILSELCASVRVVPWQPVDPTSVRGRLGFFSAKPRTVVNSYSSEIAAYIVENLSKTDFDVVIAFQFDMAMYYKHFSRVPLILEELQVGELFEKYTNSPTLGQRIRNGLMWHKYCHYLDSILMNFAACTVVSKREQELAARAAPSFEHFEIIPNFVNLSNYIGPFGLPKPNSLIYTGSFSYEPNYEAVCWFLHQVYPTIRKHVPDVQFSITGHHGNRPLPDRDNVMLTGYVENVRPYIAASWISVVPLLSGGGTRLKILEAMALGTPVVSTSKGAEGLDVRDEEHLLIADGAEEFARAVVYLLNNPALRETLAASALRLVQERYAEAVVIPNFLNLVERVGNKVNTHGTASGLVGLGGCLTK